MSRNASHESDERWFRHLRAVGQAVALLGRFSEQEEGEEIQLTEIRAKLDADQGTSVLLVLKAVQGSEKLVGFVGGLTLETALLAAAEKLRKGLVRWREDRPWGG